MTTASTVSKRRRYRRRDIVILFTILAVVAGTLLFTWYRITTTLSYVQAEDLTNDRLDDVMFAAIGDGPNPSITFEKLNPCSSGGHGKFMTLDTTASGVTMSKAVSAADNLVKYLHGHGYKHISRDQTPAVRGVKDGVTVTMRYDGQEHLLFGVATGCNVDS